MASGSRHSFQTLIFHGFFEFFNHRPLLGLHVLQSFILHLQFLHFFLQQFDFRILRRPNFEHLITRLTLRSLQIFQPRSQCFILKKRHSSKTS
eukprot:UN28058